MPARSAGPFVRLQTLARAGLHVCLMASTCAQQSYVTARGWGLEGKRPASRLRGCMLYGNMSRHAATRAGSILLKIS
jgi:hypothetical protein